MRHGLLNWLHFALAVLELPPNPRERHFWGRLAVLQLIYSLAGLVFGLTCVVAGTLLFFHGVSGSSSWVGEFIGVQSKLSDAAPGTVLFVVGLPIDIELRAGAGLPEKAEHERREHERHRKAS